MGRRGLGFKGLLVGLACCSVITVPATSRAAIFVTPSLGTILGSDPGQAPFMPGVSLGAGVAYFRFNLGYRFASKAEAQLFDGSVEMLPIPIGGEMSRFGLFAQAAAGSQPHARAGSNAYFAGGGLMVSLLIGSDERASGCSYAQCSQYYYGLNLKVGGVGGQTAAGGAPATFKGLLLLVELPLGMNP